MKKYLFYRSFSILIVVIFTFSSITSVQAQNSDFFTKGFTVQEKNNLKQHFLDNSMHIANTLIKNAIQDNKSGLKWDKYFNLTDNSTSKFYFGYYYGAAGIGDYFSNLYNQTLNKTYLTFAIKAYDYINAHAITNGSFYDGFFNVPGFVFWTRSEDSSIPYIGVKYGNPGINTFLFNLYFNTQNVTYLNLAEKSLRTLMYVANEGSILNPSRNGIYWNYSLVDQDTITDIVYGNAGIVSSFLDGYKITKNETYLNIATNAIKFIISESGITDNTTNGQRFVRFSPSPFYPFTFTGYLTGASGIGSVLLDYYQITNNNDYLLFARQIGNWLAANEKNGLWKTGGADLLTEQPNEDGSFTGYGAGSAGIGIFLLDLYHITKDTKYLQTIKDINDMFTNLASVSGDSVSIPIQKVDSQQEVIQSNLKMGLAGIGLYFSSLYHYFGLNESLNTLSGLVNYLDSKMDSNGIIPTIVGLNNSDNTNFDLSLLEGLTGIGYFYLQSFKSLNSTPIFDSASYYKGVSKNKSSLPGFEFFPTIIILVLLIKRKKLN